MAIEILSLHPEGCIAFDRGIVLAIHRAPIQGARVAEVRRAFAEAIRRCPDGVVSLGVFRLSPEFPIGVDAGGNRAELAELWRMIDASTRAMAIVVEFGGIRAAVMKLMTRAVQILVRPRAAIGEFDRLSDAIGWLRPHAARAVAPEDPATYYRLYQETARCLDELDMERNVVPTARSAGA